MVLKTAAFHQEAEYVSVVDEVLLCKQFVSALGNPWTEKLFAIILWRFKFNAKSMMCSSLNILFFKRLLLSLHLVKISPSTPTTCSCSREVLALCKGSSKGTKGMAGVRESGSGWHMGVTSGLSQLPEGLVHALLYPAAQRKMICVCLWEDKVAHLSLSV